MKRLAAIYFLLIFYLFSSLFLAIALAEDVGDLHLEYTDPIFPPSEIWFPGKSLTKSVLVGNLSDSSSYQVGMKAIIAADSSLADALSVTVRYGIVTLWGPGSLRDLADGGEVLLTKINPGGEIAYDLTVGMNSALGNDYQSQKTTLDFTFGFVAPAPTSSSVVGAEEGVSGDVPACGLIAPGSPQKLAVASGGAGKMVLSWESAGGAVTHYLIVYGRSSGHYIYGNPNVGKTTSYVVSGLSGGTAYYFAVKAVNDCAPGPFSNEVSEVAIGGTVTTGPATGFQVLGAKSDTNQKGQLGGGTATSTAEVAGVKTTHFSRWWFLLLLIPPFWLRWRWVNKK